MEVPGFDGTAATSVVRLRMYLDEALANETARVTFGQGNSDQVPVEHAPPADDSYELVLGDLRLLLTWHGSAAGWQQDTDTTRVALAPLVGVPVDDVLHYAIVVRLPGGVLAHRFCGMPTDGIRQHADAIQSLAVNQADIEASKLAAGCHACGDDAPEK